LIRSETQTVVLPAMPDTRVRRFTRTERGVHWIQATGFLILLITGFALSLPQIESAIGHRELMREIHLSSAFLFAFGPTIVALAGDRGSLAQDLKSVDVWDADDLRWLIPFPILRLFGIATPPQGRFNAGQKLNAIFVAWCTITFTLTGLILWQNRRFPLDVVSKSNDIHTLLAYIALAAFLAHLFLATAYPQTKHSFRAITQGWVRADWAKQHHSKWFSALRNPLPAPPYDALRTTAQIVIGSFIALFASRVLFFGMGANTTDKTIERLYDLTAWPGVASIAPHTADRIADWPAVWYLLALTLVWLAIDQTRRLKRGTSDGDATD
jgi:formate dehydrogenase subunit gamma